MPDTENNTNNNINNNTQEENLENNINSNLEENLENTEENLENINNISNIKKELEEYKKYKELFLRTAAEYENFRKRSEKEKESIYSDALSYVISNIISIGDSIDSALNLNNNNNTEENNNNYKTGIELLKNQFDASLKKLGVESFGEIGEKFNPDIHNAISHIEQEEVQDENVISSVFQKGYKTQTKVIRHAMVQVTN